MIRKITIILIMFLGIGFISSPILFSVYGKEISHQDTIQVKLKLDDSLLNRRVSEVKGEPDETTIKDNVKDIDGTTTEENADDKDPTSDKTNKTDKTQIQDIAEITSEENAEDENLADEDFASAKEKSEELDENLELESDTQVEKRDFAVQSEIHEIEHEKRSNNILLIMTTTGLALLVAGATLIKTKFFTISRR